ncbi:hypothetical protein HPP92_020087 [Vanilla planifolia]|uniref:Uncharacterized protein n=1 Tax=Vanilla planifolia TaxID=51239 RepID=A0A835PDM2_VANPL|nr:hypothetical protein HPP92_027791 [Vanilla planifolia]KAG0465923.1 hypothetical protein HPP92_020087 [Vanilla planifolia]
MPQDRFGNTTLEGLVNVLENHPCAFPNMILMVLLQISSSSIRAQVNIVLTPIEVKAGLSTIPNDIKNFELRGSLLPIYCYKKWNKSSLFGELEYVLIWRL